MLPRKRLQDGGKVSLKHASVTKSQCKDLSSPADDASSTPHQSNGAIVELPAIIFGCLAKQHESLGIRHNLGSIQSLDERKEKEILEGESKRYTVT